MADPQIKAASVESTTIQISADAAFAEILKESTVPDLENTELEVSVDGLPYSENLYSRVQQNSESTGTSAWSNAITFSIAPPKYIIGVCLDNTNAAARGVWNWIDAAGNKLTTFDSEQHETFLNMAMVTMDAARSPVTMTKIPKFYIRTAVAGIVGTFSQGKKCWWISSREQSGFRVHPAFKRSATATIINDAIYVGTYVGHKETSGGNVVLGSKVGQVVYRATTAADPAYTVPDTTFHTTVQNYAHNRNSVAAGVSGFNVVDIWDMSAVRLLALIKYASADYVSICGAGGTTTGVYPLTGATTQKLILTGTKVSPKVFIDDFVGCWEYAYEATEFSAPVSSLVILGLRAPYAATADTAIKARTLVAENIPAPIGSTGVQYIRDVISGSFNILGTQHDLMEIFYPTAISTTALSSFVSLCEIITTQTLANTATIPRPMSGMLKGLFSGRVYGRVGTEFTAARLAKY